MYSSGTLGLQVKRGWIRSGGLSVQHITVNVAGLFLYGFYDCFYCVGQVARATA